VNRSKTIFSESDLATLTLLGNLAAVEITSKRNLDEILKGRQELEGRVEERTAELSRTNQQLSREIVERKRVETTLTNQLLFFQSLIDTIPSPIYYKNAEGKYMGCNKAYEVYRGVTRNELIGKTLSDILPPEHAKKRLAKDAELFANPGVQIYEDKDIHSDGTFHDFIFNKATFYNTDGTVAGLAGVIIDITARKRAEMDLRGSEERFRAVFETAQDCIFIKSPDLRYTHVNPSMLRMLEMPHAAVIGLTDEEIFGEKQAKNLRDIDLRVLNGQIIEEQHSITLENNRIVFNCIRVPIRNAAGQITGLCGIARDVTERTELSVESEVQDYECRSRAMRATLAKARLAARSESIILLLGESGSGKDYLARFIHDCSNRASGPFFTINCAALPPELAESELFGHEPGAFTGAQGRKRGLLELAEGGTLLLNEIGELSPHLQAKLLTFLDTKTFTRVGGEKNISVNARLIAATNRNLEKEVKAGRFREDLYYRLDVFSIEVPPLRKRLDDLPILAAEILRELAKKMGLDEAPSIELHALRDLAAYHWPGNIRELRNVLERALILCDKKRIKLGDLAVNAKIKPAEEGAEWSLTVHFPHKETLNEVTMDLKRHLVIEALQRSGGSRKGAAELLGITADALKHYMRVFNLYR
jgi:PAS domain S-box-containing protein